MNKSGPDLPVRGLSSRLWGAATVARPPKSTTGALLSQLFMLTFRTKLLLTRLLLRGYIRLGAVMYRHTTKALTVRRSNALALPEPDLIVAQRRLQRFVSRILLTKLAVALIALCATFSYTNPYTPPGYEGYVYEQPRIIGAGGFKGTQIGPANFGISFWRNKVINIDIRPQAHVEHLAALASDDLPVSLQVTAVLSIVPGNVTKVVEDYGGVEWYPRFIEPRLRSLVDAAVERRSSSDLKRDQSEVERDVRDGLADYLRGTPFVLRDLAATDISYPKTVAQAVEHKLQAKEVLEERQIQVDIARQDAQIGIVTAQGKAEENRAIAATLTPMLLQYEEIEAQAKGAASPSRTTVYVPTSPGGIPVIAMPQLGDVPQRAK